MGNNLFGADIADEIARELGPELLPGTITRSTPGARDSVNLAAGPALTSSTHTFRGIRTGLSGLRKDTILPESRDAILVLGDTITPSIIPTVNDRITIENTSYSIVNVSRDPDAATYICQVR